jgi:hypothetical protein
MNYNGKSEIHSNIASIRELEDCIRSTKRYTKGAFRKQIQHPIQGEELPSKVLTEYYEVYPTLDVDWNMPARTAIDWLWGDIKHIDVHFVYDYRYNKAYIKVKDGKDAMEELVKNIPGFKDALDIAIKSNRESLIDN